MVSPVPGPAAAGTPRLSTDIASRKRAADDDAAGESTMAKKASISGRGQLTMRRSGKPASFHGLARPSIPAGQSTIVPRHVPRPGPLSLPTPASFNFAPAKSSKIGSQVISPASSSSPSFSSAPSSIESFQLSAEVRQSLSRPAHEASTSKSNQWKVSDPAVAPPRLIPQFGPAHRLPPESEDEDVSIPAANGHSTIARVPNKPQSFELRLAQAQEQSQAWQYIKDKLDSSRITCRSEREQEALLEILQLPKQNILDDKPMRETDKHKRRYCVIIGSILQVVGVKGHCDACGPHSRAHWAHRQKTCTGLPPEAAGPRYRNLVALVAGRCSNCIRSTYNTSVCHFSVDEAPADAGEEKAPDTASDHKPDDACSQGRVHVPGARNPDPKYHSRASAPGVKVDRPPSAGPGPRAQTSAAPEESAEAIIRDAILIGFRASTQLQFQEQRDFLGWMTALFSSSASFAPDLEGQAIEALLRLRRLPAGAQADIRRRILQMLPGAMGRSA